MTATYTNGNISFLYPENWSISESEEDAADGTSHVTLESPGGGFWYMFSSPASANSKNAVREVMAGIEDQFEGIEWNQTTEPFHGIETTGFDGFFYALDLLICARIRVFKTLDRLFVILVQSENSELDRLAMVYDAITMSLLQSTAPVRQTAGVSKVP